MPSSSRQKRSTAVRVMLSRIPLVRLGVMATPSRTMKTQAAGPSVTFPALFSRMGWS
jgi:hypothetical protein